MINEITRGRKIIVFGCGGERDRGKRELMMQAAIKGADHVIATEDNPRNEPQDTIFSDMKKGIQDEASERKVRFIADRRNAIAQAFELAQSGDCVLIAGKGHETYQEEKGTMIPFDDRKVARELIENLYFKKRFSTDED
jgi:UDP-N-acetylmuramoyl-L-alanyl-D-glutamate--2,6-diaminopimelate ligase